MPSRFAPPRSHRRFARALACAAFACALAAVAPAARASWPSVSANLPVCNASAAQNYRSAVADGAGGMYVAWSDLRYSIADIVAQHVLADGTVAWAANGIPVCTAATTQDAAMLAADGAGGVYVVWRDQRFSNQYDLYAQHIAADGTMRWTINGIPVVVAPGVQTSQAVIADGLPDSAGVQGVIVAWEDDRDTPHVWAQRFSAAGTPQWGAGLPVGAGAAPQFEPALAGDGAGGAVLAWSQQGAAGWRVFAERIDSSGVALWDSSGVRASVPGVDSCNQFHPRVVTDGAAGAWIAWEDDRSGAHQIFAQRLRADGTLALAAPGAQVAWAWGDETAPVMAADGAGGAVLAWNDNRVGADIYAQRFDSLGTMSWASGGLSVCSGSGQHMFPSLAADGSGGFIFGWEDTRNGSQDIFAQKIGADGVAQWTVGGVPVSIAPGNQYQVTVVSSGDSAAVMVWTDFRSGNTDLYAQRIPLPDSPFLSHPAPRNLSASPNPARESTAFAFELPEAGAGALTVFDALGRRVRVVTQAEFSAGGHRASWDARDESGRRCPDGVYFARLVMGGRIVATRSVALMR